MKKIVIIFSIFATIGAIFTTILALLNYMKDSDYGDSDLDYYGY